MEEAWQLKCSSGWSAQPSYSAAPGSYNQINMNAQQFYHPVMMKVSNLGGGQILQEPFLPCYFNSDLGKSCNSETRNSFLDLLSGNSNHLSGELHSPNLRSELSKLPVPNGDTLGQSTSHSFSTNCFLPFSKLHCNDAIFSGDHSSFIASRQLLSTGSKVPDIQDLQSLSSHSHILGSTKAITRQPDIIRGIGVPSKRCGSSLISPAFQHQNNQTSSNSPSDATVNSLIPPSSFFIGRPRVLCMNATGELFLNDMGRLGVLCSCHYLPMSVAKFCEHSGVSSTNPSEAIMMESGMTLAQWCKICFGNLASGDLKGSEQSKHSSVEDSSIGFKASSHHSLSKNDGTINSVKAIGRLGRSGDLTKNLFAHHHNLVGHASMENPVKNDLNYDHEKGTSVVNGLHRIGITDFVQVSVPVILENNDVQSVNRTSEFINTKTRHSTSSRREQNVVSQLFSDNFKFRVNSGNASVSIAPLGPKNFFSNGKNDSTQSNSSKEALFVGKDGSDLRLGQPSQHKHSSLSSSTGMNLQLQNACRSPKVQEQNQLPDESSIPVDDAREVKRARLNPPYPFIEESSSATGQAYVGCGASTSLHNSESEDLLTYANKDSSISLFLSHLIGGTGLLDSSVKTHDRISCMTSSIHDDLPSSKENSSLRTGNEICESEKASSFNEFDHFNDKGKPSVVVTDTCCNMGGNNVVNSKQIEDRRVNLSFLSGQCLQPLSAGRGKSSLCSSQPLRSLHKGLDAKNSNKQGNLPILENGCHPKHVVHGSAIRESQWRDLSGCPDSEVPITSSSTNSSCTIEANCLSCKQDTKFSDHLMDANLRLLASARHERLMAKQEQPTSSFKMKQHRGLCCLSAPHRNSCSDNLVEHKDATYCNIQRNASNLHSLPNCYCNNYFRASHCKCGSAASYKCCSYAAQIQSTTPCSSFSSHHVCGTDRHTFFRPRDILIDSSLDSVQPEVCMYKAGAHPVSGNCFCTIQSKCHSGCFGEATSAADFINDPNVNEMLKDINPTFDEDATFWKERTIGLDKCACFKKMVVMHNNCQSGFWRDVSGKIVGYSAATPENHVKTSEVPRVDKLAVTASKKDLTYKASTSLDEQQMSNRSGSLAPAMTEVSVEVNKKESHISSVDTTMILNYSEFNEGSVIEKSNSCDELIDEGKCKVPNNYCKVLASCSRYDCMSNHSSASITNELKFRDPSNQKRCTDQENNCGRHQSTRAQAFGNKKESSKPYKMDKTVPKSVFDSSHSQLLGSIDEAKCLLTSKQGLSMHPEDDVESTGKNSGGSLNIKKKRSYFISPKFISLKKLENQSLRLKNSKHPPKESKISVAAVEKANFTFHGKQHSDKRLNHLNGERPPKYMSLSCIVGSRNHEMEASPVNKRPVVCGNSGIIFGGELNASLKPAKIVPLNLVLKKAKRCRSNWEIKPKTSLFRKLKSADPKDLQYVESSSCKSLDDSGNPYFVRSKVRSGFGKPIKGTWFASHIFRRCAVNKDDVGQQRKMNIIRSETFPVDAEALCCVCGSSNKEETNCLLECNRCMIRVHQACYDISNFPKDLWYCSRPCKTNSPNIGLLQSEIEGEDNEKVGFYGKCILHAISNYDQADIQPVNVEALSPRINEWACARTKGFRGRGRGYIVNYQKSFNDGDGCTVSQVQINAWLHINGQKSCMRGVKPACSDVEYDLRKEYIRYKLSKGWKRLVVYKSGIHALGLYTSQFIDRGATVVEYVGEIVGLRVADKRETEYQSGRRLQCKSACYFFRVDKEHIIDATRKGGIARFVNHSCLPNCVAKIISIKNEKKVIFFAERDINPGEEITYDYHFNREDEGKKIPCFCNSSNCRRYLN